MLQKLKQHLKKYYCKHQDSVVFKCPCWGLHEVGFHTTQIFTKLTSAQRLYVETYTKFHLNMSCNTEIMGRN